jgi:hypothetical protein
MSVEWIRLEHNSTEQLAGTFAPKGRLRIARRVQRRVSTVNRDASRRDA